MQALALLLLFPLATLGQDTNSTIGCYVEGECQFSPFIEALENIRHVSDCHLECSDVDECVAFTYEIEERNCFLWAACVEFVPDACELAGDCMSSDESCDVRYCTHGGLCEGNSMNLIDTSTDFHQAEECRDFCDRNPDCAWWSYDHHNKFCELTADCDIIEPCDSCERGEKFCSLHATP